MKNPRFTFYRIAWKTIFFDFKTLKTPQNINFSGRWFFCLNIQVQAACSSKAACISIVWDLEIIFRKFPDLMANRKTKIENGQKKWKIQFWHFLVNTCCKHSTETLRAIFFFWVSHLFFAYGEISSFASFMNQIPEIWKKNSENRSQQICLSGNRLKCAWRTYLYILMVN